MWLLNTIKEQSICPVIKKKEEGDKKIDRPSIREGSNDELPTKKKKLGKDASNSLALKSLEENGKKKEADKPYVDNEGTVINILRNILKPN